MNAKEFRNALDTLGLTKAEVADLLRIDERSVRRYAAQGIPDGPSDILMWLLYEGEIDKYTLKCAGR